MKTGVIFPSYAGDVVWAPASGAWEAAYPVSSLNDLIRISKPARANSSGTRSVGGVMSASRWIQAVALVGHNVPAGLTMRVWAFSGTGYDLVTNAGQIVYDSGEIQVWPSGGPASDYRAVRPLIFLNPVQARSVLVVVYGMSVPLEVCGIDVGAFWEWPGISYGREMGIEASGRDIELVGGAKSAQGSTKPRMVSGQVDLMAMAKTSTTGLDFQKLLDVKTPFVWVEDYDLPATWARKCMLVKNQELPPMVGALYRHDAFPVRMKEHMR